MRRLDNLTIHQRRILALAVDKIMPLLRNSAQQRQRFIIACICCIASHCLDNWQPLTNSCPCCMIMHGNGILSARDLQLQVFDASLPIDPRQLDDSLLTNPDFIRIIMHSNSIPMTRDALFHASMHHDFAATTWQSVVDIHAVMLLFIATTIVFY